MVVVVGWIGEKSPACGPKMNTLRIDNGRRGPKTEKDGQEAISYTEDVKHHAEGGSQFERAPADRVVCGRGEPFEEEDGGGSDEGGVEGCYH